MIDYAVKYGAGFYHIMQRGRITEVCWNNNKANVFPVQTDTPLMGCQTNFLLSESWRQPNRHSNHNSSHLWALRGNIHMPHYYPLCLMITYRHRKHTNLLYCEENLISTATYAHVCSKLTLKPAWETLLWKHPTQLDDIFCVVASSPTQMRELRGDAVRARLG